MASIQDVRNCALSLPEVVEHTHFNLPAFKVKDKTFVVLQKGDTHAIISVSKLDTAEAVASAPAIFEEVWRSENIFVGLRADIDQATQSQIDNLVTSAWCNKAPKTLVNKYKELAGNDRT